MFNKPNLEDYKNKPKNFIVHKKKNPLISIVTISKNSEKTIQKTIDSLKKQTFKDFEFIIIDCNSNDKTIEIIKKNLDIVDVFVSEKDRGPSDGMNKGISLARGSLIFWLASDDWIDINILSIIEKNFINNNDISFFYGNMIMHHLHEIKAIYPVNDCLERLLKGNPDFTYPAIVFNRKVFEKFGLFSNDLKINNDFEFILRILRQNPKANYIKEFNVDRLPGGAGETHKLITLYEIFKINLHYKNLSIFICKYLLSKSYVFFIISIKENIRILLSKFK
jgi:glycosyltransferase involved in cell wall biosynthesis